MYKTFYEVTKMATDSKDKCEKEMTRIPKLKGEFKQEEHVYGSAKPISIGIPNDSISSGRWSCNSKRE